MIKLNTELSETRSRLKKEQSDVTEALKVDIKHWKKELGKERKLKIKFVKKLEESRSLATLQVTTLSSSNASISVTTAVSVSSQTDSHPDIPYAIDSPLPQIFSSQLCKKTPQIKFLSRSHPDLDSICWRHPDINYEDEAEQALNDQYDREVQDFYLIERDRVKTLRQEHLSISSTLDNSMGSNTTSMGEFSPTDY